MDESALLPRNFMGDSSGENSLNLKNYINIISFVLNAVLTGVFVSGPAGLPTNVELSLKYQVCIDYGYTQ